MELQASDEEVEDEDMAEQHGRRGCRAFAPILSSKAHQALILLDLSEPGCTATIRLQER
jgi:hypothetical protein